MSPDVAVIGGGLVGAAIAYGLTDRKVSVLVLDGGDRDLRASSGNAGLVWLQGKGMGMPAYQRLTRASVKELWPTFAAELTSAAAIDLEYECRGGLSLCVGQEQLELRRALLTRWQEQGDDREPDWEMLDRSAVAKLLPKAQLGPDVVGASFGYHDGQVNPLRLLGALHAGIVRKGGQLRGGCTVRSVETDGHGAIAIDLGRERISAARVVIAAGLGSRELAAHVGLEIPMRPQRGQLLVTERLDPLIPLPLQGMSQTRQGTLLIGATNEENIGYDISTTTEAAAALSARAIRWIPALCKVRVVRHWAALRIMTPDSYPVYAESQSHPGIFVATCHSGVTLAAAHAIAIAEAIATGRLPPSLEPFHHRRFDVPKAAA